MDFYRKTRFWNDKNEYVVKYDAQKYMLHKDNDKKRTDGFVHSDCSCGNGE